MVKFVIKVVGITAPIMAVCVFCVVVYAIQTEPREINRDAMPPQGFFPRELRNGIGKSMEPTMKDGESYLVDPTNKNPQPNDIISFDCLVEKCKNGDPAERVGLDKRVIKRDGDRVWVEGDNKAVSYDSRYYGWLTIGKDIEIDGVYEIK